MQPHTDAQEQLMDVCDRLEDLSSDTAEARAANILHGLGFTRNMQQKATKDFSGGVTTLKGPLRADACRDCVLFVRNTAPLERKGHKKEHGWVLIS